MRWEAGQRVEGLGDAQQWQAPLWQALVSYTAELGQPQWHRANLYQRFISTLEKADEPPAGLPSSRLHLRDFRAAAGLSSGAAGAG